MISGKLVNKDIKAHGSQRIGMGWESEWFAAGGVQREAGANGASTRERESEREEGNRERQGMHTTGD